MLSQSRRSQTSRLPLVLRRPMRTAFGTEWGQSAFGRLAMEIFVPGVVPSPPNLMAGHQNTLNTNSINVDLLIKSQIAVNRDSTSVIGLSACENCSTMRSSRPLSYRTYLPISALHWAFWKSPPSHFLWIYFTPRVLIP